MQKKRVATFVTALSLIIGVFGFATPQASITAEAADTCHYKVLSNASQINDALDSGTPSYTVRYSSYDFDFDKDGHKKVLDTRTLNLAEDSFVYIGLKRRTNTDVLDELVPDLSVSGAKGFHTDILGTPEGKVNSLKGFLYKGSHRLKLTVGCYNFIDRITGSTDVYVLVIPISKAMKISKKVAKNKKYATITVTDNLGSYSAGPFIKQGRRGKLVNCDYVWGSTAMQRISGNKYIYKVFKNGKYTIIAFLKIYDGIDDTEFSAVTITVSGIKNNQPTPLDWQFI